MDVPGRVHDDPAWIEPTPGFSQRVLAAVGREAREPGPIPFPWRRLALGAAAILAVSTVGFASAVQVGQSIAEGLANATGRLPTALLAAGSVGALLFCGLIGLTARLASR
jgi:hypothetical protein